MIAHLLPEYTWRGARGPSLLALLGDAPVRLDPEGVRAAFGESGPISDTCATCVEGARIVLPPPLARGEAPGAQRRDGPPLRDLLEGACARLPEGRWALALSGGVDSAVLAALLGDRVVCYTLAPTFPGYGEEAEAALVARALGVDLRRVRVREEELVAALPAVVRAAERPLYNLHPVSRHPLARVVRADGFDGLVSGDGADEVFHGTSGADYLPVVGALTRAAGLAPGAPFLDATVAPAVPLDPEKRALRALALTLGVPEEIAHRPKRPRFAPAMDLARHWDGPLLVALGRHLGREPSAATDRARVGWATLGLFSRLLPGLAL